LTQIIAIQAEKMIRKVKEKPPFLPKIVENHSGHNIDPRPNSGKSCLVSDVSFDAGSAVEGSVGVDAQRVGDAAAVADGALVDVVALLAFPEAGF
jgi:hypothetical protein